MKRKQGRPSSSQQIDQSTILDVAVKAFARNGYEGTQMKAIADEAGCAKSLMNYHFKNKDNLWKRAFMHMGMKLMLRFEERRSYFKDLEGIAAMKAYVRQLVYFSAEFPEFHRLIFLELGTQSDRATWIIDQVLQPIHQRVEQLMASHFEDGQIFPQYPMANLVSILIGVANTHFSHAYQIERMYGVNPFDKAEVERHADIVIDILFAKFQS